ncbi:MAG: hypothetical protein J2P23_10535 [Microlunatus sp.]|nr:hypothetical protein [Microlunatus sp.]
MTETQQHRIQARLRQVRSYLGLEVVLGQLGRSPREQLVTKAWSAVSLK